MATLGRIAEEVNVVTDGVGRVAVVADAIYLTGSMDVEAGRVDGGGGTADTGQSRLGGLRHFVQADDEYDLLGTPGDGSDAVAVAVDVDDDAVLGDGVGAGEIDVGREGTQIHRLFLFGRLDKVAVQHFEGAALFQVVGDADVTDGHGAAPGDTAAIGDEVGHLVNRLLGGGTIVGGDVTVLQMTDERGSKPFVAEFFGSHGGKGKLKIEK